MYGFADFRLEPGERRLWRGEASVALTPKTFDLLLFLVEHEGRLLRKNDLLSAVWPDSAVEENNLTVAVSALRKALGESEARRFIETVPKKGYRFIAQVTDLRAEVTSPVGNGAAPANRFPEELAEEKEPEGIAAHGLEVPEKIPNGQSWGRYRFLALALSLAALTGVGYLAYPGRSIPSRAP